MSSLMLSFLQEHRSKDIERYSVRQLVATCVTVSGASVDQFTERLLLRREHQAHTLHRNVAANIVCNACCYSLLYMNHAEL
eukprot:4330690-Amphidinium_carterae.2